MTVAFRSQLILGGARSGKSRFAIAQAKAERARTAFLATAEALDRGDYAKAAELYRQALQ